MFERLRPMLIKEFIQAFRDPRMKFVIFVAPAIQVLVFGYAVTTDVKHITTAICDRDRSVLSRDLAARFAASGHFDIVANLEDGRQAQGLLDRSEVQAVVEINENFQADIQAGRSAPLQVLVDGSDSNTAGIILSYCVRLVRQFGDEMLTQRISRIRGAAPPGGGVVLESRAWFNENLESRIFFIPGVIAIIVMLVTLMLTSMAVVREKEIGTMEQIMVTPMTPVEFILGKTLPFALIGLLDVMLITLIGVFWFDVPIRGTLLVLLLSTILYLMTTLGVGLLISTVSETQQQAMMSTFFFYFPAVLLSGFMFPIANMPPVVQFFTYLNPLRYFLVIIRGVFLKGVGVAILWPQMLALAVMGVLTLTLATGRFRKTLS
jgi:ABC-2 type transport system permease protein